MTTLLIALYIAALALEVGGGSIVAADILKDRREIRRVLEARNEASAATSVSMPGFEFGGGIGAMIAQGAARQNVMDDFTLERIRTGYSRRWWGIGLVVLGALVGTIGNVVSTFAP